MKPSMTCYFCEKKTRGYHDQDRITDIFTGGRAERVWLNISFKNPIQQTLEAVHK